jgi:hypothetical protein
MAASLGLDAGQKSQIAALYAKLPPKDAAYVEERKARIRLIIATFESDAFDSKKLDLGFIPGKKTHEAVVPYVDFFSKVVPILRPNQREKLAGILDKQHGLIGGLGTYDE